MPTLDSSFTAFLLRAKRCTYAAGAPADAARPSSRQGSRDLGYNEGPYTYLDTYLGGYAFVGEEAVWFEDQPVWGMNYYGSLAPLGDGRAREIPAGFSDFLKQALRQAPEEAPYRGPRRLVEGPFEYRCRWEGAVERFRGDEQIALDGQVIYTLDFHGGMII